MTKLEIKIALYTLAGIIALVIVYFTVKLFKKSDGQNTVDEAKKAVKNNDLSYKKTTYDSWAERLFLAMQGAGTNTTTVFQIVESLKTPSDWNQLVTSFGIKKSYWFEASLIGWLQDELSTGEFNRVRSHLQKIGITL
ncbi:MAG TPA: hypothetical protein DCQ31_07945 [Bacteroidales bacterium]|nr:hypothetical protein [Bacteroidales bacterium]